MQILAREGYELTDRALSKIRKDNEWTLRSTNGMKPRSVAPSKRPFPKEEAFQVPEISPEVVAKRNLHFQKLQADSDERLKNRTRRVRTMGWAGMGPDPPMEPRFPSEMTISQSKEQLGLSKEGYTFMRNEFQTMCEVEGLTKKTLAGTEKWQAIKQDLVRRCNFLQNVLDVDGGDLADGVDEGLKKRRMALDIICSDVTKKIRTSRSRVTIPDAKSAMGINPAQGSELRKQFYQILLADHFTSKIEAGPQHWNELKEKLITRSTILQEILVSDGSAAAESELNKKKRALEVLCRDVMKRLRDDQTKKAKGLRANSRTSQSDDGALVTDGGPSPDHDLSLSHEPSFPEQLINDGYPFESEYDGTVKSPSQENAPPSTIRNSPPNYRDMDIDPTLINMRPDGEPAMSTYEPHHPIHANDSHPEALGINAWFRLSDTSPPRLQPRIWLSAIPTSRTIDGIHAIALSQYASLGVQIVKIEAHTRYLNSMTIDRDDELAVFLQNANRETPTFVFHFAPTT